MLWMKMSEVYTGWPLKTNYNQFIYKLQKLQQMKTDGNVNFCRLPSMCQKGPFSTDSAESRRTKTEVSLDSKSCNTVVLQSVRKNSKSSDTRPAVPFKLVASAETHAVVPLEKSFGLHLLNKQRCLSIWWKEAVSWWSLVTPVVRLPAGHARNKRISAVK